MRANQYYRALSRGGASLLDYTNFDIIYSLRKVNPSYAGFAIKLRRDSDLDIEEFSFVGTQLPESAILAWAGASSFRLEELPNQGIQGVKFNLKYVSGTRSLLGTAGAFNLVNGKIAIKGQTSNRYASDSMPIAESAFAQYGVFSSVIKTQSGITDQGYLGEVAFPISGNVGKGYISSTSTGRNAMRWIETGYYSQAQLLIAQASQNQQRQYSRIYVPTIGSTGSSFRWNKSEQDNRPQAKEWANPSVTTVQMFLMSGILGTFLGDFQESVWKIYNPSNEAEQSLLIDLVENEQNTYYGIF